MSQLIRYMVKYKVLQVLANKLCENEVIYNFEEEYKKVADVGIDLTKCDEGA